METFLESVAAAYCKHYKGSLEDVLFVFPSKRAGSFFLRSLYRQSGADTLLMPAVTSFADFVEGLSGRVIDSRIDQICLLYDIYRRLWVEKHGDDKEAAKGMASFDKFRSWAETMLSDFNDVEMFRVNPEALFTNVSRLKDIRSTFLTPEQLEVMSRYFGYTDFYDDSAAMWRHYHGEHAEGGSGKREKFLTLFDLMGELFTRFCDALEQRGLTFQGHAYVLALESLGDDPVKVLPYKRVVMVGFNALSTVEYLIFDKLQRARVVLPDGSMQQLGDFYWDLAGEALSHPENIGRHFVSKNMNAFPSQFDISFDDCCRLPSRLEVISSPSGVAQAKIAGTLVRDIVNTHKRGRELVRNAGIAIVLPDENLLLPMIYSMPKSIQFNITMGYPFKVTSVASFISLVETMQRDYRFDSKGMAVARTADINALLVNPLSTILLGWEVCGELYKALEERGRTTVPASFFANYGDEAMSLFKALPANATNRETLAYLSGLLLNLEKTMSEETQHDRRLKKIDLDHVVLYLAALRQLEDSLARYSIRADSRTTFRMFDNLLAGEVVRFEGEPLEGVQLMGPLETRCLDIPYLIIPSMNERIYPRRFNRKSFIPAVIRRGFGMATTHFQEAIFTYYFYRMISRASEVYLIYDSRTEGLHSGSPSRFILQLEHLYAKEHVRHTQYTFRTTPSKPTEVSVRKTPQIQDLIEKYFGYTKEKDETGRDKNLYLSASSLNTLIDCPLRFYIEKLRSVSMEPRTADGMSAMEIGTVIHKAVQNAFTHLASGARPPFEVTAQMIDTVTDKDIEYCVLSAISTEYYDKETIVDPDDEIRQLIPHIMAVIRNVLRHDRTRTPFTILSMEQKVKKPFTLSDGTKVNFTYIIDRVDEKDGMVRIVDYKTGEHREKAVDIEEIFACSEKRHPDSLFQLMLYSYLWQADNGFEGTIIPVIYDLSKMNDTGKEEAPAKLGKKGRNYKLVDLKEARDDFMAYLEELISGLRDKETPFQQAPAESEACRWCPFAAAICSRMRVGQN